MRAAEKIRIGREWGRKFHEKLGKRSEAGG